MKHLLEICVDSIDSAMNAQVAGADRIELCDNLLEGGTTPSYGTILSVRKNLDIAVNVIVRPRGGDFLYSDSEFDIMRRDIELCGEAGINGVVIGLLTKEGFVDAERTAKLVEFAGPMSVTFHRAFDMCNDPFSGLEDIITAGASRILTSGQKNKVPEGLDIITRLVKQAADRIIIMPGSGIDENNIKQIAIETGASEFHLTGRKIIDSSMEFRMKGISMGGHPEVQEFSRKVADIDKIRRIKDILDSIG
jgi:copper homeostasis protein